jgi:NAD(P)-dependent dehydrogenase (short-subunit alcohol dehydrogenase family)
MTDQQWKDVIDVNLTGTANTIPAVILYMIPRKSGRVILVSSGQGRHGMKDGSAYSASKWGIIGLMKSVALELSEYQITVNTLEPGLVDTPMTRNPGRWIEPRKEAGNCWRQCEVHWLDHDLVQASTWFQPRLLTTCAQFCNTPSSGH